jgi:dTDP-4-dehydrorhamnose reductase
MMRVMLIGAAGMLGHDLVHSTPPGVTLYPFTRADLDITNTELVAKKVSEIQPEILINAAAYTAVDRAEAEREPSFRVNAYAVGELGRIAAQADALVVHFSTDYVFDGIGRIAYVEDAATNPINVYGASKLAGERALEESGVSYLLIRTSWLFGSHGRSFPKTMWERAKHNLPTKVVDDQFGRPRYTRDLARATWTLVSRRATGAYHLANEGVTTWFGLATHVFARLDRAQLLTPCVTEDYPVAAKRPRHAVLATSHPDVSPGTRLRAWPEAVDDFLASIEVPPASS